MKPLVIRNAKLVNPGKSVTNGEIGIANGRIAFVGARPASGFEGAHEIDAGGRLVTPGLIDIHTHGIAHCLYANGASEVRGAARELGRFGVTTVLPTLIPQMKDGTLERLAEVAAALPEQTHANMPGLHLEGPFMAVGGAACPTLPGDLKMLDDLLAACQGRLATMSLSPDAPNIVPVIRALRERNIPVMLTHTRAGPEQTEAALEAGATHATHFYDVFHVPPETDPGVRPVGAVEAILADPRASVDFIADGVHVHPTAIRAALAAKGWSGVVLITDSNIGAGLPPGVYPTPWGYSIRVSPETAARHVTKNSLSGSALTMDRGMANLFKWLKLPPEQIWAMGTLNPARVVGLERKGRLDVGADADLVLWYDNFEPAKTWVNGNLVYEKAESAKV